MADGLVESENSEKSVDNNLVDGSTSQNASEKDFPGNDITSTEIESECHQSYTCTSPATTPEDAMDQLLAGEQELDDCYAFETLDDDEIINVKYSLVSDGVEINHMLGKENDEENIQETEENGIDFEEEAKEELEVMNKNKASRTAKSARNLRKKNAKCLNKMQIMENVREGCNANQPSSPGHAEQRQANDFDEPDSKDEAIKKEDPSENGIEAKDEKEFVDVDGVIIKEEKDEKEQNSDDKNDENSNCSSENNKRKLDGDELPIKKIKVDIQENFNARDKIINEFIEWTECNTPEQIQTFSEHILSEIKTLNELAKEKEREWNQILHMKKLKEELLIRIQRKRQMMIINDSDFNEFQHEVNGQLSLLKCNQKSNSIKNSNAERSKQKNLLQNKHQYELNSSLDFRQKQRPTLDVQSIIADYRQRHPEVVPRRGRRIRHSQSDCKSSILGFSGSNFAPGQKPDHEGNSELGFLLNNINGSRENSRSSTMDSFTQDATSYKDILVQFAKLSQKEKNELQIHLQNTAKPPPPPYPEVTVHPVTNTSSITPSNSLLHGILTKTPVKTSTVSTSNNQSSKSSFSPTLARLLTAPERASSQLTSTPMSGGNTINPSNMSLSEIFSGSKARNEITITPVGSSQYDSGAKVDSPEDDSEEHPDRLIIDETTENTSSRPKDDNSSENGDDIPQCQGCNQKPAQFVCAGCGNQWYCSRDCQVAAWDEHSEVCSG